MNCKNLWLTACLLLAATGLGAQALQPGFDRAEYAELMRVSARTTFDTVYANKHPAPSRFRMAYRSEVSGLDNLWDLWADGQGSVAISIRGTTKKQESWLENFYAAMVPAVYLFYPETAGRTLEDMDDYYRGNPPLLACLDKEGISSKRPQRYSVRDEHSVLAKERGETAQHLETA